MNNLHQDLPGNDVGSTQPNKLIRIRGVISLTDLSKSYIYKLSSDGLFPKSVQLVAGGSAVAWVESEIQEWIQSRISARDEVSANA
jgi:prophage regulatory protein